MGTILEKTIAGDTPTKIVHDDRITSFRGISPQMPVRVLIVPNEPIPAVNDVSNDDERRLGRLLVLAPGIVRAEGIADDGLRFIVNYNEHGGQVVYQLHMHLLGHALEPILIGDRHG